MKMTKLSEQDKKFVIIVSAITVVAVAFLLLVPGQMMWRSMKQTKPRIAAKARELKDVEKMAQNLPKLRVTIAAAEEEIAYVESRLPNSREVPQLLAELDRIAKSMEIAYAEMVTLEARESDRYVEIPLRIRLRSPFHDLGRFVNNVENSSRFAKIDAITISGFRGDDDLAASRDPVKQMEQQQRADVMSDAGAYKHDITVVLSTFMFVEKRQVEEEVEDTPAPRRNRNQT